MGRDLVFGSLAQQRVVYSSHQCSRRVGEWCNLVNLRVVTAGRLSG